MLKINVEITLTDDQAYTSLEAGIVSALAGKTAPLSRSEVADAAQAAVEAKATPAKAAPAAKAAPVKAAPAKAAPAKATTPKPPVKAAEPVEEPAEEDVPMALEDVVVDDEVAGDPADDAVELTLADAVKAATELVAAGKQSLVKEALSKVGAKRVSEVKPAKVAAFIAALEA